MNKTATILLITALFASFHFSANATLSGGLISFNSDTAYSVQTAGVGCSFTYVNAYNNRMPSGGSGSYIYEWVSDDGTGWQVVSNSITAVPVKVPFSIYTKIYLRRRIIDNFNQTDTAYSNTIYARSYYVDPGYVSFYLGHTSCYIPAGFSPVPTIINELGSNPPWCENLPMFIEYGYTKYGSTDTSYYWNDIATTYTPPSRDTAVEFVYWRTIYDGSCGSYQEVRSNPVYIQYYLQPDYDPGIISSDTNHVSAGDTIHFISTRTTVPNLLRSFEWQYSTDSVTWHYSAGTDSLTTTVNVPTYFRRLVNSENLRKSIYVSNVIKIIPSTPTFTFTPASGNVGTLVTVTGTNLNSPTGFSIGGVNTTIISNTGSTLVGMVMAGTPTGIVSVTYAGGTVNSSSNFRVIQLFPSVQQGAKLVGTGAINGTNGAQQGYAVSISSDGNTAIVGGNQDNSNAGAAWIYTRSGTTWSQQTKLAGTGGSANAGQGYAVSLSADGNTAILGGPGDSSGRGAVWVFTRSGNTWGQQGAKLVGTGNAGLARQGYSVSLSADGNTAIVGGSGDSSGMGAVWIFTRIGSTWSQQGTKLVGTGITALAPYQGVSVSVSADGNTAIVGRPGNNNQLGAAWVFTRTGSTWAQQGAKLVGTGTINALDGISQGISVSLSANGNTALVGGSLDNFQQGAAWVFTRSGSTWSQQGAKLVGTGNTGAANQGISVSLSADGNTAIVGGLEDNSGQGATWVYTRSGSTWTQEAVNLIGNGNVGAAKQGISVSLSADGTTAIVGGPNDNSNYGAAWVFVPSSLLPVKLIAFAGERQGTNNLLHWVTASEQNNKGFELQHSANGETFSKIAFVNTKAAQGNSTAELKYNYTDKNPPSGGRGAFYRLRQMDNDGKETLSNIVFIKGETNNEMTLLLTPNPTTNQFTLTAHSSNKQPISIRVLDAVGKMIYAAIGNAEQIFRFGEKLPNGLYMVEVKQGEEVKVIKAVKGR